MICRVMPELLRKSVYVKKMSGVNIGIFDFSEDQIADIILHELGHALGIRWHTTVSTDIMYYKNDIQDGLQLTQRETATLQAVYDSFR